MAKPKKKESNLTYSGFEYDQELARVSIKVFPALQALIANQHELMDIAKKHGAKDLIFLEAHKADLNMVENTIAQAYGNFRTRKKEAQSRKEERKKLKAESIDTSENRGNLPVFDDEGTKPHTGYQIEPGMDAEAALDEIAAAVSPGLPSSRLAPRKPTVREEKAPDVRRIAIGASIKALSGFLGRELTEEEMLMIEKQVDAYL